MFQQVQWDQIPDLNHFDFGFLLDPIHTLEESTTSIFSDQPYPDEFSGLGATLSSAPTLYSAHGPAVDTVPLLREDTQHSNLSISPWLNTQSSPSAFLIPRRNGPDLTVSQSSVDCQQPHQQARFGTHLTLPPEDPTISGAQTAANVWTSFTHPRWPYG